MKKLIILFYLVSTSLNLVGQNPYEVQPKSDGTKKTERTLTADEKFVSENFPFIHMADWKPGMRFMVETDKYADISRSQLKLSKYKKSGSNSAGPLQKEYQGKIFKVVDLEERQVSCPRGRCTRTYVVLECEGEKFEYEFIGSREEMRGKDVFTTIDKLIYIDEIDKAREVLIDKKMYFLKASLVSHPNFIPVTIKNVGMGSGLLYNPIKIVYSTESGKEFSIDIKLSGTNTYDKGGKKFYEVFSFENPRNKYPEITDEIWLIIQERKVRVGMTEKECELSWGRPEKVNTNVNGAGRLDQWVYSTDSYLYFESGKLTSIQN